VAQPDIRTFEFLHHGGEEEKETRPGKSYWPHHLILQCRKNDVFSVTDLMERCQRWLAQPEEKRAEWDFAFQTMGRCTELNEETEHSWVPPGENWEPELASLRRQVRFWQSAAAGLLSMLRPGGAATIRRADLDKESEVLTSPADDNQSVTFTLKEVDRT